MLWLSPPHSSRLKISWNHFRFKFMPKWKKKNYIKEIRYFNFSKSIYLSQLHLQITLIFLLTPKKRENISKEMTQKKKEKKKVLQNLHGRHQLRHGIIPQILIASRKKLQFLLFCDSVFWYFEDPLAVDHGVWMASLFLHNWGRCFCSNVQKLQNLRPASDDPMEYFSDLLL